MAALTNRLFFVHELMSPWDQQGIQKSIHQKNIGVPPMMLPTRQRSQPSAAVIPLPATRCTAKSCPRIARTYSAWCASSTAPNGARSTVRRRWARTISWSVMWTPPLIARRTRRHGIIIMWILVQKEMSTCSRKVISYHIWYCNY